jgi:hypothetical protein
MGWDFAIGSFFTLGSKVILYLSKKVLFFSLQNENEIKIWSLEKYLFLTKNEIWQSLKSFCMNDLKLKSKKVLKKVLF